MGYDISVIMPTYNRAEVLAQTLKAMVAMEIADLSVEFVIVDNNSTDQTKDVVESFSNQLRILYLFEPNQGKNRALNCALKNAELGNIVVFTDDDVSPASDWLTSIMSTCMRWPDHSVFGGHIEPMFQTGDLPSWASDDYIRALAFSYHNYSDRECVYKDRTVPFGPNYWVRREVFSSHRHFDVTIGPHPKNQILGDETLFLLCLLADGYEIVYSPHAVVVHRVKPDVLTLFGIATRGYQHGRGQPYLYGLPRRTLLDKSPLVWRLWLALAILRDILVIIKKSIVSPSKDRVAHVVEAIANLANHIEAGRLASDRDFVNRSTH